MDISVVNSTTFELLAFAHVPMASASGVGLLTAETFPGVRLLREITIAPGGACQIDLYQHLGLAPVDSSSSLGWAWDPTGCLYVLTGGGQGSLDDVLAAVRRTYP